jgi:hypothetical protein
MNAKPLVLKLVNVDGHRRPHERRELLAVDEVTDLAYPGVSRSGVLPRKAISIVFAIGPDEHRH